MKAKTFIVTGETAAPRRVFTAEEIKKLNSNRFNRSVPVHCVLQLYTDNIDVLELGWNNPSRSTDTVLVLKEIYSTPKMNL